MWSDEEQLYSSDEEEVFFGYQINSGGVSEEEWRASMEEEEAREQAAEQARALAQTEYDTARTKFDRCTTAMNARGIRKFNKLKDALVHYERQIKLDSSDSWGVFARGVPVLCGGGGRWVVNRKREYIVATYVAVFAYCHEVGDQGVELEECIVSSKPMPVHFDIEIKQETGNDFAQFDATKALATVAGIDNADLANQYKDAAAAEFTEEECKAGVSVMTRFVQDYVERATGVSEPRIRVCSACRGEKFSLHMVCKGFLAESTVLSMGPFVFEAARAFGKKNVEILQSAGVEELEGPERAFRTRALMLSTAVEPCEDAPNGFVVNGWNDSPFDEAIYSVNHLMRAPGCSKPKGPALHPVEDDERVMSGERAFWKLFSPDPAGFESWCCQLITKRESSFAFTTDRLSVLMHLKPSVSFPSRRRWHSQSRAVLEATDAQLSEGCLETLFEVVRFRLDPYKEDRRTRIEQRQLTSREMRWTLPQGRMDPRESVDPEGLFRSEDGTVKPFKTFREGEFLHHTHNGREERTPSARVFRGGFHCFGCQQTFVLPRESPWEPSYEFLPEEIVHAAVGEGETIPRMQRMPNINWRAQMPTLKKFYVMSAPMETGKTFQVARLLDTLARGGKTVLSVTFRRMLATQLAQTFGLVDYREPQLQARHWLDVPLLSITLNSLPAVSGKRYDIVVIDEAGLVRRANCSNLITGKPDYATKAYTAMRDAVRQATHVILMQVSIRKQNNGAHGKHCLTTHTCCALIGGYYESGCTILYGYGQCGC